MTKCRNFNSILVQLEGHGTRNGCTGCHGFQFHIGAIRRNDHHCMKHTHIYFNSILVQLEAEKHCVGFVSAENFNSILVQLEVATNGAGHNKICRFQFHIGAIRSGAGASETLDNSYFNSILVQLEAVVKKVWKKNSINFNSILVQLEVARNIQRACRPLEFQFHIGAIRSCTSTHSATRRQNFNSILVQLEVLRQSENVFVQKDFNSILVQLEAGRGCGDSPALV